MAAQRRLLEELGGEYRRVTGNDVARGARRAGPLGERHPDRARRQRPVAVARAGQRLGHQPGRAAVGADRRARHLGPTGRLRPVASEDGERRLPAVKPVLTPLSPRRQAWGWAIAVVGLPLLTVALRQRPRHVRRCRACCSLYLMLAMVVALVGGVLPAAVAVIGGLPARQLVLHAAVLPLDHHRRREPPRPRRLRRRRRHRRRARRPRRPQPTAGRPGLQAEAEALAVARRVDGPARLARRDARPDPRHVRVPRRRPARGRDGGWHVQVASGTEPPARPRRGRRHAATSAAASPWPSPAARCRRRTSGCSTPSPPRSPPPPSRERLQVEAGQGQRAGRRQRPARRAAAGGVARPAHAAGVDQGVDLQPAPARHRLAARRRRRVRGDDRRGDRPPRPTSSATCST